MIISIVILTKRAQYPFRSWLPLAITAPTSISAIVHSSTLVTVGVYLLLRFSLIIKNYLKKIILILSLVRTIYISFKALKEEDMKKIIAYSTLRQIRFLIIIKFIKIDKISSYHLVNHALIKAIIFIILGIIITKNFSNQLSLFFFEKNKLETKVFMLINIIIIIGTPGFFFFVSKERILIKIKNLSLTLLMIIIILITRLLSIKYIVKFFKKINFFKKKNNIFKLISKKNKVFMLYSLILYENYLFFLKKNTYSYSLNTFIYL